MAREWQEQHMISTKKRKECVYACARVRVCVLVTYADSEGLDSVVQQLN